MNRTQQHQQQKSTNSTDASVSTTNKTSLYRHAVEYSLVLGMKELEVSPQHGWNLRNIKLHERSISEEDVLSMIIFIEFQKLKI